MMRFKRGSKVEVMNHNVVPSGTWRSAQIISGNGHTYCVKYDISSPDIGAAVERVPRKAIRPCPPSVKCSRPWMPGDIVEVFDICSWKIAEISNVLGDNYFFVRLLGSSRQFRAHMSNLRLRQSWKGNKWVVIGQDSENLKDRKMNKLSKGVGASYHKLRPCIQVKQYLGADNLPISKELSWGSSTGKKRRRDSCLLTSEMLAGGARKKTAGRKEGWRSGEVAVPSSRLFEKVDAVVSPQMPLGEKCMHASLNNRTIGFFEMDTWKADDEFNVLRSYNQDDTESITSSVGSCSCSNSQYRSTQHLLTGPSEDLGSYRDDANSFSEAEGEPFLPTKEVSAERVHQLELRAYCSTLAALYASGPISWEQETLLTNLRLMLHISNDEHLMELRHLFSSKINMPCRAEVGGLQSLLPKVQADGSMRSSFAYGFEVAYTSHLFGRQMSSCSSYFGYGCLGTYLLNLPPIVQRLPPSSGREKVCCYFENIVTSFLSMEDI